MCPCVCVCESGKARHKCIAEREKHVSEQMGAMSEV